MVDTAIIYCKDGILIYTPHKTEKWKELKGGSVLTLDWLHTTMNQAKEDIGRLKE